MRIVCAALAMLCVATPAVAQDADRVAENRDDAREQRRDDGPVSCIVGALPRTADRDIVVALVRKGFEPANDAEERTMQQIANAISRCRGRYGWGDGRRDIAIRYFSGSILRSNAAYQLRDYGVRSFHFDKILPSVPEAERERLMTQGAVSGATMTVAARALEEQGAAFGSPEGETLKMIGGAIAQGLAGSMMMDAAAADYRNN